MRELINIINEGELIDLSDKLSKQFAQDIKQKISVGMERLHHLGLKYHHDGKLPLPLGSRLRNKREMDSVPSEVVDYYVDPLNPHRYGYYIREIGSNKEHVLISNDPKLGLRSTATDIYGWAPMTLKSLPKPISTHEPRAGQKHVVDPEVEKEYRDLFGDAE